MSASSDLIPPELGHRLTDGGCVRVGAVDVDEWDSEAWAAEHDRALVLLDTGDSATAHQLIGAFAEGFGFGEDCEDWDQLDECLGDLDVSPRSGVLVVWSGWESIAGEDERVMATAVDAFGTAVQAWADEGVPWTVMVVGDGPSWDLTWAGAGRPPWDVDLTDLDDEDDEDDDGPDYGADPMAGRRW